MLGEHYIDTEQEMSPADNVRLLALFCAKATKSPVDYFLKEIPIIEMVNWQDVIQVFTKLTNPEE